jgi:hypothetical protein
MQIPKKQTDKSVLVPPSTNFFPSGLWYSQSYFYQITKTVIERVLASVRARVLERALENKKNIVTYVFFIKNIWFVNYGNNLS